MTRQPAWMVFLLVACGGSQPQLSSPEPVALASPSGARPAAESIEVDIDAIREAGAPGVLRFDHAQLASTSLATQVLRLALEPLRTEIEPPALEELSERLSHTELVWRDDGQSTPRLSSAAFEVTNTDDLDSLLTRLLPAAQRLSSLDGFATDAGALVRVGATILVGDLQQIRRTLDVGAPLEVSWALNRPAIAGWFAFAMSIRGLVPPDVTVERTEFRVERDGDTSTLHVHMETTTPTLLVQAIRGAIAGFLQSLSQTRGSLATMLLRGLQLETLFENAALDAHEESVTLTMELLTSQARVLTAFVLQSSERAIVIR